MLLPLSYEYIFRNINKFKKGNTKILEKYYNLFSDKKSLKYSISKVDSNLKTTYMNNPFISGNIKTKISNLKSRYNYVIKYDTFEIQLQIHCNETEDHISKLVHHICSCVSIMIQLDSHSKTILKLCLYLTDETKHIDRDISHENVNSGSQYMNLIEIWRKEEVLKVLFHELIHFFNYDSSVRSDKHNVLFDYNSFYDLQLDSLSIYEAYTEFWALMLHCYYLSTVTCSENVNEFELFQIYFSIEKYYSQDLCYYLINKIKLFNIHQVNFVCYYISKYQILDDLKKFISLFKILNINNIKYASFIGYLKDTLLKKKKIKEI